MADQSADEIKNEAITKMGQALGEQYSALWQEVALLHVNWDEYVELFGTKPTRIELLNQAAPSFFRMIQDELWDTTLLGIARITDPPATVGKANLTVQNLPGLIGDVKTKGVVDELVKTLLKETEFCRDWRNRRIAHRDLNIALAQPAAPLKDASRAQVKTAFKALADVVNAVQRHYLNGETGFDIAGRHNGAMALLYVLNTGVTVRAERAQRALKGDVRENDFDPPDL